MTQHQVILHGFSTIESVLSDLDIHNPLLVCDGSFQYLKFEGIEKVSNCEKFSEFTSNPLYEDVAKGVAYFKEKKCDGIIAVGGGSCIDVAKCIKLFSTMNPDKIYFKQAFQSNGIPLIAIPTTAGTGSESTRYAVIYFEDKKQSITHESILPAYVILEPQALKTLPAYQKKCTMLDALCQSIESWWSINSTKESISLSQTSIELIMNNYGEYIERGTVKANEKLMLAANYAGQAINITQTTAAHAMSYKLTSLYHLPHGHAVALCLVSLWPYMLEHMECCVDSRGREYLSKVFCDIAKHMGGSTVVDAIEILQKMLSDLQIASPHTNNIQEIDFLTNTINPVRMKNNPVLLDAAAISELYNRIVIVDEEK